MIAQHHRDKAAPAPGKVLRTQAGAFDLTSVLVGVVVVVILTLGVFAVVFGAIPWVQDNAAKRDLENVRTAEGVAMVRLDGFKDKAGLVTGNLLTDATTLTVGTNAGADCYVGISKSATGRVFYNTDKLSQPAPLTPATDPGCLDAASRDLLLGEVGGYSPNSDDKDGDGVPNAEDPTPNGGAGGGGATDTDGDGTPDSEDPTPNGEADPNALPAGHTWSSRVVATNSIKDPSFELGSTGWTTPRPSSVAKSVGHAPGMGVDGGSAVTMISSGTAASDQANFAYLALPSRAGGNESVNIKVSSSMGVQAVYGSIVTLANDGSFLHETAATTSYVGGTSGWQLMRVGTTPWHAGANPAEGFTRYLQIRVGGNYNDANLENYQIYMDQAALLTGSQDYFDGTTLSSGDFSYDYAGELHDSVSEKSTIKQFSSPSVITLGQEFTVTGRGYPANTEVTVSDYDWNVRVKVTTDASGNFTTTLNIPVGGPEVGPGQLEVFSGNPMTTDDRYITKDVTFQ